MGTPRLAENAGTAERKDDELGEVLGKASWTAADAQQVLRAVKVSGLSVTEFSRRHGLVAERLFNWKRKLGPGVKPETAAMPTFVPVRLVGASPEEPVPPRAEERVERSIMEVVLGSGWRVRVAADFDAGALRRLLSVLEAAPC
jgi:transposase-like protein